MTLKLQTDEVCRSFQLRRNGGTYIRSVVRTAIVASVVESRSSAALQSAEFSRTIGNIIATLLPALAGLSLCSLTNFVSALGLAALFGLPDVMRVAISAPGFVKISTRGHLGGRRHREWAATNCCLVSACATSRPSTPQTAARMLCLCHRSRRGSGC